MKLELKRKNLAAQYTEGDLFINGRFFCNTLEDAVRGEGQKIPGETAIPAGEYKVQITWSPRFNKELPILLNVPMFAGIRIHPGNDKDDTEGCILVGVGGQRAGWISDSRKTFQALMTELRTAEAAGEDVVVVVA